MEQYASGATLDDAAWRELRAARHGARAAERYQSKGVVVLGILTSDNPDDDTLLSFASDNMMTYPIVRATSDILVSYQYPDGLPTTFIFDRGGKQVFEHKGPLKESKLAEVLEPLVKQKI